MYENGEWTGKSYEWRVTERKRISEERDIQPWQVSPPDGDSLKEMGTRVREFLNQLLDKNHESVLVVSHGDATLYMMQYLLQFDFS